MNSGNPLSQSDYKPQKQNFKGGTLRIDISKEELEELYVEQKLSTYQIAKVYGCWDSTIGHKLKEAGIVRRNPKKKRVFPKQVLEELYLRKKYSISKIAKKLDCGHATVWHRLKEYDVPKRKLKRYEIARERLSNLYLENKLSQNKVAEFFGCSQWVISNKLNKFKLEKRNPSEACQIYERKNFSNNPVEKAYLIGFRLGDLHVKRKSVYSLGINSSTTKPEQFELMRTLFEKYAHVQKSCSKGVLSFSCRVNNSFSFLEPKEDKIEGWILKDERTFFSFLAGYTDAEGNIGVYSGRARYRVGSYDKNLLFQVYQKLNSLEINTKIRLESLAGYCNGNTINNGDFWRVSINYKDSLLRLFNLLEPYLKHGKRIRDLKKAKENVIRRLNKEGGEVVYGREILHYNRN